MLVINKPISSKIRYLGIIVFVFIFAAIFLFLNTQKNKQASSFTYPFAIRSENKALAKLESEISFYKLRSQANPNDGLELASLAALYLKKARVSGWASWYLLAEQSARHSLANLSFNNNGALLVLAKTAEARHDFKQSINLAQRVLNQQAGNKTALSILISSNLATGNINIASEYANQLIKQLPSASSLGLKALVEQARGNTKQAQKDLQQAISYEEVGETYSSAWLRTKLALLESQRGNYDLAKKLYLEALRIVPEYPLAILYLAALETEQKNYQKAISYYKSILYKTENSATVFDHQALQGLARANYLLGNIQTSGQIWAEAEAVLKNDVNNTVFGHKRELAGLLLERGHPEDNAKAMQLLSEEVNNRHDVKTLGLYAWSLIRAKNYKQAKLILDQALATGIQSAAIYYQAANLEKTLANFDKANSYFKKAKNINPLFNYEQWQKLYF